MYDKVHQTEQTALWQNFFKPNILFGVFSKRSSASEKTSENIMYFFGNRQEDM